MRHKILSSRTMVIIVVGLITFAFVVCGWGSQSEDIEATVAAAVAAAPGTLAEIDTTATMYQRCWELIEDLDREIAADFNLLEPSLPAPGEIETQST